MLVGWSEDSIPGNSSIITAARRLQIIINATCCCGTSQGALEAPPGVFTAWYYAILSQVLLVIPGGLTILVWWYHRGGALPWQPLHYRCTPWPEKAESIACRWTPSLTVILMRHSWVCNNIKLHYLQVLMIVTELCSYWMTLWRHCLLRIIYWWARCHNQYYVMFWSSNSWSFGCLGPWNTQKN